MFLVFDAPCVLAGPSSSHYELKDYGFGAGGTASASLNYGLFGVAGEMEASAASSNTYKVLGGLTYEIKAPVPPAPTFSNPATNYDRLLTIINAGTNQSDATYAVEISTDSTFASDIHYIQSDFSIGSTLIASCFMNYTTWNSASGKFVTGLYPHTTYYARVKARQGNYTESEWGAVSLGALTSDPSLTFGMDNSSITFNSLNAGNSYTDSSKNTVLTTSTNAYNGYVVWANESGALSSGGDTIADYAGTNNTPTTWSGTGFGYTTSDSDLQTGTGGSARFSGSKYAGFSTTPNQDPVADHTAKIENPSLSGETFTISYNVVATSTNAAGTYKNTIIYTVVPIY